MSSSAPSRSSNRARRLVSVLLATVLALGAMIGLGTPASASVNNVQYDGKVLSWTCTDPYVSGPTWQLTHASWKLWPGGSQSFAPAASYSLDMTGQPAGSYEAYLECHYGNEFGGSMYMRESPRFAYTPPPVAPSAPLNVQVTSSLRNMAVEWQPVVTDGGAAVTYDVLVRESAGAIVGERRGLTTTSQGFSGLSYGVTYEAVVTAVNSAGSTSAAPVPHQLVAPEAAITITPSVSGARVGEGIMVMAEASVPGVPSFMLSGVVNLRMERDGVLLHEYDVWSTQGVVTGQFNLPPQAGPVDFRAIYLDSTEYRQSEAVLPYVVVANAPAPPRLVQASHDGRDLTVSWFPPSHQGGEPVTYTVDIPSLGRYTGLSSTSLTVPGIDYYTTYEIVVTAVNSGGQAAANLSFTPVAPTPTVSIAVPGDGRTGETVTVEATVDSPGVAPVDLNNTVQLTMERDGEVLQTAWVMASDGVASAPFDLPARAGSVRFRAVAYATGHTGLGSAAVDYVVGARAPSSPQGVTATPAPTEVRLTWAAPASDGGGDVTYRVRQGGDVVADGLTAPELLVDGLANATTYEFVVEAVNAGGSTAASAVTVTTPPAQAQVTLALSDTSPEVGDDVTVTASVTADGQRVGSGQVVFGLSSSARSETVVFDASDPVVVLTMPLRADDVTITATYLASALAREGSVTTSVSVQGAVPDVTLDVPAVVNTTDVSAVSVAVGGDHGPAEGDVQVVAQRSGHTATTWTVLLTDGRADVELTGLDAGNWDLTAEFYPASRNGVYQRGGSGTSVLSVLPPRVAPTLEAPAISAAVGSRPVLTVDLGTGPRPTDVVVRSGATVVGSAAVPATGVLTIELDVLARGEHTLVIETPRTVALLAGQSTVNLTVDGEPARRGGVPTGTVSGPAWVTPTGELALVASGFAPGETVAVYLHAGGRYLGTATADADGTVTYATWLPRDLELGDYSVRLTGGTSGTWAQMQFSVAFPVIVDPPVVVDPPVSDVPEEDADPQEEVSDPDEPASDPDEQTDPPLADERLPVTGVDVSALVAAQVALIALGALLIAFSRRQRPGVAG